MVVLQVIGKKLKTTGVSNRLGLIRQWRTVRRVHQIQYGKERSWSRASGSSRGDNAEVAIIGGGAVGTSLAYHLAKKGLPDVVLIEKNELTAGSTWHAAGLTAFYHPGINVKRVHYDSLCLYSQLQKETQQDVGFHQPGSIRLATTPQRMDEFHYQMQRQGWHQAPQRIMETDEILAMFPIMNTNKVLGGLYNPADGHIDPYSLTQALAIGARKYGARLFLNTQVTGLKPTAGGHWTVETNNGTLNAKKVINAAGFWAHEIGRMVGVELPLVPIHHQYLVTATIPEVQALKKELPVIRHLEGSFYLRQERNGLLVGPYESAQTMKMCEDWAIHGVPTGFGKELFEPDVDRMTPHLEVAMDLVPCLRTASIQTVVSGPIMYTPDILPAVGPFQGFRNLWMAVGFGYGIIHAGGIGRYLSEWILNGEPPYDLIELDPNRYGKWTTRDYVFAKARESYGHNNAIPYPFEERWAGRPTSRVSAIYHTLLKRGAQMHFVAGWEKPAWFALPGDDADYKPSFRRTNWFEPVKRECDLVLNKVGIIDLSPFGKFEVTGPDAMSFLDRLLANNIPKVEQTNISHMLTPKGKVYGELTVTNLGEKGFFCVTGSGSELHDLRWIEDHVHEENCQVNVTNVTEERACLGLAGPKSRNVLRKLTDEDLEDKSFPFLRGKLITIAHVPVLAIRISYTGELGWELYHDPCHTRLLYDALLQAGHEDEIGDFGILALNSLRIEKGFRAWGSEMTVDSNPYEAGLRNFIRINKEANFMGKEALVKIQSDPLTRSVVHLLIESSDVDPVGNETVWCANKVVGYTTSGCYGQQTKSSLAMAYLPPYLAVSGTEVQVELLNHRKRATVLAGAPVLPENERGKNRPKSLHHVIL